MLLQRRKKYDEMKLSFIDDQEEQLTTITAKFQVSNMKQLQEKKSINWNDKRVWILTNMS